MHETWNVYDDRVKDDYGGGGMSKNVESVMEYMSKFDNTDQFLCMAPVDNS